MISLLCIMVSFVKSGDDATIGIVIEPISTPYPGVYHRQYIVVNVVPGSDAAKNGIQVDLLSSS